MKLRTRRAVLASLVPIFIADLFFSFHYNATVYINSSFLAKFFSTNMVSLLFILGSVGNILLFLAVLKLQKRYGNRIFFFLFLVVELISVLGLALASSPFTLALLFITFESASMMILYSLDLFLEDKSPEKYTGVIRGIYLTLASAALVLSPLMITLFAPDGEFARLYLFSALCLTPLFAIGVVSFGKFKDGREHFSHLPLVSWFKHKNLRRVTLVRLTLNIFYSFMVIYMPIYLHGTIGFAWTDLSIIFTIMLLPFVLFQVPIGQLADRWCGEKEMMTLGLFIMGTMLLIMPFIQTPSITLWAVVLFLSRIGASMIEETSESYFFKQVDKHNLGMISIFRITWPLGFILGPIFVVLALWSLPFTAIFLFLALLVLKTMNSSAQLRDTL
jgi:MFS family permease